MTTTSKPKQKFFHPALENMKEEERAFRKVLQAIDKMKPMVQLAILRRAIDSIEPPSVSSGGHGFTNPSMKDDLRS